MLPLSRIACLGLSVVLLAACDGRSPESTNTTSGSTPTPPSPPTSPSAPAATADSLTINMNAPRNTVDVLANDTDADGDTLTVVAVTDSQNGGKVRLDNGTVIYEPPLNYTGSDTFTYSVSDGGLTTVGTVNVTVNGFNPLQQPPNRPCETEAAARKASGRPYCFDILIPSHDGKNIGATVFIPADRGVSKPPMILHAHGFGEARFASLENPNNFMINRVTAQSLLELWHEGYWVVSYDQRGFNASVMWGNTTESSSTSGDANCVAGTEPTCIDAMNPEREGRDMVTVVDWMVANLRAGFDVTVAGGNTTFVPPPSGAAPLFAEDETDDPVLGTIGLSYGGGFQTIGTAIDTVLKPVSRTRDTRVNAMVPVTTWHDFRYSLVPADVPKTGWIQFLAVASNTGGTAPGAQSFLPTVATQIVRPNTVTQQTFTNLYLRSLRAYCEGNGDNAMDGNLVTGAGQVPGAANGADDGPDVFVIQGQRDLLFNYNEALDMAQCYQTVNPNSDVRLLIQTEGHVLGTVQAPSYKGAAEVIYIDETIYCGGTALSTRALISGWFREKLGVIDNTVTPLTADDMPTVCTTHFNPQAAPVAGVSFNNLNDVPVGGAVVVELDGDPSTPGNQDITFQLTPNAPLVPDPTTQAIAPIPPVFEQEVYTASAAVSYSGIPTMNVPTITVTATPDIGGPAPLVDPPRFFVGIAVQRQGAGPKVVIADQVAPIVGTTPTLVLPGCLLTPADCAMSTYSYPRTDPKGFEHGELVGRLVGGSVNLEPGDKLFFQVYTQYPLYHLHGTLVGAYNVTLTATGSPAAVGTLRLPILP